MKTIRESILKAVENSQGNVETQEVIHDDERFLVVVVPLPDRDRFDRPWKSIFIEWLRRGLTVEKAAHLAGVSRRHAYICRDKDDQFSKAWNSARQIR